MNTKKTNTKPSKKNHPINKKNEKKKKKGTETLYLNLNENLLTVYRLIIIINRTKIILMSIFFFK